MININNQVKRRLIVALVALCFMPSVGATPKETKSPYAALPLNLMGAQFVTPNVLLFVDNSGSMDDPPNNTTRDRKIDIAKKVTRSLFTNNTNIRWGLSTFDPDAPFAGGILVVPIADYSTQHAIDLDNAAKALGAETSTPMAEAYLEMLHYFAGVKSAYYKTIPSGAKKGNNYISPIQYRCQKNYIIYVTDGEPTSDSLSDTTYPDSVLGSFSGKGGTFFISDLAKAAYEHDFKPDGTEPDLTGKSFNSADFPNQNINTFTVGFSTSQQLLENAGNWGNPNDGKKHYFTAYSEIELNDSLQSVIQSVNDRNSASAAPISLGANHGALTTGFNTTHWTGTITSYAKDMDLTKPKLAEVPSASSRLIFTNDGSSFKEVSPSLDSSLTANSIFDTTSSAAAGYGLKASQTLSFLAGKEPSDPNSWRARCSSANGKSTCNMLGDFIDSEPALINENTLAVGSNDGLLHVFQRASDTSAYSEVMAYAPSATLSKVGKVAQRDYGHDTNPHRYLVDGSLVKQDLNFGSLPPTTNQPTMLIGALGRGGKGYYGLDLSSVLDGTLKASNLLSVGKWDKNSDDADLGSDLGYTFGRPVIAKVKNGNSNRWVAIVSNGFDNGKKGELFFLNPITGAKLGKITVDDGSLTTNLGLGNFTVLDTDKDNIADYIYAGDLNGDVWRVDLTHLDFSKADILGSTPHDKKIKNIWKGDASKPITAPISIWPNSKTGYVIIFGTGSLIYGSDKTSTAQQTLYGIYDDPSVVYDPTVASVALTSSDLLKQTIISTPTAANRNYRITSDNYPSTTKPEKGWYLDLPHTGKSSERIAEQMLVINGGVFFTTQIPMVSSIDKCTSSFGDSWFMVVSAIDGSRPIYAPTENLNQAFKVNGKTVVPSGYESSNGMLSGISIMGKYSDKQYSNDIGIINNLDTNYRGSQIDSRSTFITNGEKANKPGDTPLNHDKGHKPNGSGQGFRISWQEISQE